MQTNQSAEITGQTDKQPLTNGTPAQPQPEATKEEKADFLSPKFAALARKEKQLRAEQQRFQQERAEQEQLKRELAELRGFKQKFETNPLEIVDYDKLTEQYLAQPNPELRPLLAKIKELEEGQKTFLTQAEQREKQQYDAAVNQIRQDATRLVSTDPAYEVIKELGTVDEVVKKITDHYEQTGEVKEISEAAKEVQEDFIQELTGLFKLPAIQKLISTPKTEEVKEPSVTEQQSQAKPQQPQPTLSNRIVQSGATKPSSAKDKRERAIRAFMGQPIT